MKFQNRQSILPQQCRLFVSNLLQPLKRLGLWCGVFVVAACTSMPMTAEKPRTPTTLEEAKLYMESRTKQLEFLEYEVNQQSIACYKHFFVASCLDDVRSRAAEYRRAHVQVQGEATEMIRLDAYQKRQAKKSDKSN